MHKLRRFTAEEYAFLRFSIGLQVGTRKAELLIEKVLCNTRQPPGCITFNAEFAMPLRRCKRCGISFIPTDIDEVECKTCVHQRHVEAGRKGGLKTQNLRKWRKLGRR